MEDITVFSHPDCIAKDNGENHPERKERLIAVLDSIKNIDAINISLKEAPLADYRNISLVHPLSYLEDLFSMVPTSGLIGVEKEPYADTILCSRSKEAILRACGAGIESANEIMSGATKRIFCAIRPPGHHAETTRANGFCFVNNAAVTARYLQNTFNLKKIAIVDFDVHHGNGTQEIFYADKSVFYGSIHQHPLFPGTGLEDETGVGNIFNAPISSDITRVEFMELFETKILKNLDLFEPEVIIISAGFDAHTRDPLAGVCLESKDYFTITKNIVDAAKRHSDGRVISFLEGGYDLQALSESIEAHLMALSC